MKPCIGMFILNIKILFSEKVVFVWSLILTVVIFIVYTFRFSSDSFNISEMVDLFSYFWAFIIISSAFNGVGIHLSKLRNFGLLKTYTLIAGGKAPIISGVILTQLVLSAINIVIFTIFAGVIYQESILGLTLVGLLILLFTFIPIALISFIFTYLPAKDTTLSTLLNFSLYFIFFFSFVEGILVVDMINYVNPFVFVMNITHIILYALQISSTVEMFDYVNLFFILLISLFGFYCYKKLNLISEEYRS